MNPQRHSRRTFLRVAGAGAVSALLAACGGGDASTPQGPAGATAAGQPAGTGQAGKPAASDPITLSWVRWVTGPVADDNLVKQVIKERFNVELRMIPLERATWQEQLNTRIAGGDVPDIIWRSSAQEVKQYVDQGILAEVPFDLIKARSPRVFAAVNEMGAVNWLSAAHKGKNWGLPHMQPSQLHPFTDGWRQDWLEKVGLTTLPRTVEEFEAAFGKFVKDDPDGNGAADTFALSGRGKDLPDWTFAPFFGAYGTFPNMWMALSAGEVQHGGTVDGARQALTLLQRWHRQGLIDPEFVTTDAKELTQKWANGKMGYLVPSTWYRLIPTGEHYDALKAVNPNAKIAMAWAPKGPEGKFGYFNWGPVTGAYVFGKQLAGTKKLERALELFEGIWADQELATLVSFGRQGEHWERDPETGAIRFKPPFDKPENRGPLGVNFSMGPQIPKVQATFDRKDEAELTEKARAGNVDNFIPDLGSLIPSDVNRQTAPAQTVLNTAYIEFVTGKRPLDQWGQFLKQWHEAGGKQLTSAANEAFKQRDELLRQIKETVTK